MNHHRRTLLSAALCTFASAPLRAQSHDALREAAPSPEPFARLQGGVPHHLTADQQAQRVVDSPAPRGPAGRWVARAALPLTAPDGAALPCPVRAYRAIPALIAGYGLLFMHTPD